MFGLGIQELIIVGIVAVVLFGKRLPEVAKSLGSSYKEFRQGLSEIQSQMDINSHSYRHPTNSSSTPQYQDEDVDDYEAPTAPKFELPADGDSVAETSVTEDVATESTSEKETS